MKKFKSVKYRLLFIILNQILIILSYSISALSDEYKSTLGQNNISIANGFYTETYPSPFIFGSASFQKVFSEFRREDNVLFPRVFISLEQYADPSAANITAEIGVRHIRSEQLYFINSIRREKINNQDLSYWIYRGGLIFNKFINFDKAFVDSYLETFLRVPEKDLASGSISGWVKTGYRYFPKDHLSFDPLIIMARIFDNTNVYRIGADYTSLNIGPQLTYFSRNPNISTNLIAAKSYAASRTSPVINNYWLLLAVGVYF